MNCPHCRSNLRDVPIPERHFVHKSDCTGAAFGEPNRTGERCFCLPYGWREPEDRFFGREILVEIPEVYDGGLFYRCPDCGYDWHRLSDDQLDGGGRFRRELVESYMSLPRAGMTPWTCSRCKEN
jgi:hypothetical protein